MVRTKLVNVGNAKCVRIPKRVLEQLGLSEAIELEVRGDQLIIRRGDHPRAGWAEHFQALAAAGDDALLDPEIASPAWEDSEWEWI